MSEQQRPERRKGNLTAIERAANIFKKAQLKFDGEIVPGMVEKYEQTPVSIGLFLLTDGPGRIVSPPLLLCRREQIEHVPAIVHKEARLIVLDNSHGKLDIDLEMEAVPAWDFYEDIEQDDLLVNRKVTRLHIGSREPMIDDVSVGMIETIEALAPEEPSIFDKIEPIIRDFMSASFIA